MVLFFCLTTLQNWQNCPAALTNHSGFLSIQLGFFRTSRGGANSESGSGYDKTFVSSDLFTINTANGNYYLILEVDSGATHLGKNATIEMNGCYLI